MVKELTLYEDYDDLKERAERPDLPTSPELAAAIFRISQRLESLAVSFLIDARDFFPLNGEIASNPTVSIFPSLEFVILTSKDLRYDNPAECINDLLYDAGQTALKMPKLRVMELWNARNGKAAIFRYQRKPFNQAEITWTRHQSTHWSFSPCAKVEKQWTVVARSHGCRELTISSAWMDPSRLGLSSVLNDLHLRHLILTPVSLWQIQREIEQIRQLKADFGLD